MGDREGMGGEMSRRLPLFTLPLPLPTHLPPTFPRGCYTDRPYCVDDGLANVVRVACLYLSWVGLSLGLCLPTALLYPLVSFIKQNPGGPSA